MLVQRPAEREPQGMFSYFAAAVRVTLRSTYRNDFTTRFLLERSPAPIAKAFDLSEACPRASVSEVLVGREPQSAPVD